MGTGVAAEGCCACACASQASPAESTDFDVGSALDSSVLRRPAKEPWKIRPHAHPLRPHPAHYGLQTAAPAGECIHPSVGHPLTHLQRAVVPAMAAAITSAAVFAPRAVHAEEQPSDAIVRSEASPTSHPPALAHSRSRSTNPRRRTASPSTTTCPSMSPSPPRPP
jgi:hypothetical protein